MDAYQLHPTEHTTNVKLRARMNWNHSYSSSSSIMSMFIHCILKLFSAYLVLSLNLVAETSFFHLLIKNPILLGGFFEHLVLKLLQFEKLLFRIILYALAYSTQT